MSKNKKTSSDNLSEQITKLVGDLHNTEQRLRELTAGNPEAQKAVAKLGYLPEETQQKLRESEEKFNQLANNVTDVFWIRSPDFQELHYVSPAFEKVWGRPVEVLRAHPEKWVDYIHAEDRERVVAAFATLVGNAPLLDIEYRITWPNDEIRWIRARGFKVRDEAGQVIRLAGIITDITERKQAELNLSRSNRALQMLTGINEKLIRAEDERSLLAEVCRVAVEIGDYRMAWVGFALDDDARTIKPVAHAGQESGYLTGIKLSWSEAVPIGLGPAGQTIRSGKPVVCEDITQDSCFFAWKAEAQQRGYRGVICLPLRGGEGARTFGLLALYSEGVSRVDEGEIRLLQELADDLAFGICHLRAQAENRRLQSVVLKVASGVSASTGTEFFEQLARSMAEALDAKAGFVSQLLPGEPVTGRTLGAVANGRGMKNFSYEISGTPSEKLLNSDEFIIAEKLAERLPDASVLATIGAEACVGRRLVNSRGEPVGQLFVLFAEPLKQTDFIASTLRIFAARAASELERQRADVQVREQAALLDAASDGIVLKDLDDHILFWNRGAEQIYGWTATEVVGKKSREILVHDQAAFDAATLQLMQNGYWRGEMQKRVKNGNVITVETHWTLVHDQNGQPKSILAINTDITERKKLETQFLRVQRMESIGTLAGGIAHDLNNVLAPILMAVQILQENSPDKEDQKLLGALKASALRGAELIKQVLAFARGTEGKRVPINLKHVIHDIQIIIRDTFPKSIEFCFERPKDLWPVIGNPTQLHQVFMNLCVNARDAMVAGGRLEISLENMVLDEVYAGMNPEAKAGPHVLVTVSDTGSGIPKEIQDKIFDPFFSTKEVGNGTGLGLSTVQSIVKSHGGFIDLDSVMDQGTRFKIYFPAEVSAGAPAEQVQGSASLPHGRDRLVLVVDDEETILAVTEKILKKCGYRVLLAANGAEAVSLYAQHRAEIAAVLTDMAMPVMDGPATIRALRAIDPQVKIIGSSGHASGGRFANITEAEVKFFIPKPYSAETMLKVFDRVINEPSEK